MGENTQTNEKSQNRQLQMKITNEKFSDYKEITKSNWLKGTHLQSWKVFERNELMLLLLLLLEDGMSYILWTFDWERLIFFFLSSNILMRISIKSSIECNYTIVKSNFCLKDNKTKDENNINIWKIIAYAIWDYTIDMLKLCSIPSQMIDKNILISCEIQKRHP